MHSISFFATIKRASDNKGGSYIEFPYDAKDIFNKNGRIKVVCLFESEKYRGSLVQMGEGCHIIGIKKEIMSKLDKTIGDSVFVTISEDLENRYVELNDYIKIEMDSSSEFKNKYETLSYTKKKEINEYIKSAKKESTRKSRIEKIKKDILKLSI